MNQPLTIHLKTRTPLWTGGVEIGKMARVHETGIVGSLRWWYEAVVRGLGGSACDPTHHTCNLSGENLKRYEQARNSGKTPEDAIKETDICQVCKLFGATGWQRRFRLLVAQADLTETWSGESLNIRPPDRNRGWYLNAGQMGTLSIRIIADDDVKARLLALFYLAERWGNLGARPQLGYGRFTILRTANQPEQPYRWTPLAGQANQQQSETIPDLRLFTFFSLTFTPERDDWWRDVPGVSALARDNRHRDKLNGLLKQGIMPTTPALKDGLRYGVEWSSGALPHQFFGTLRGNERSRSKIAISWAYRPANTQHWQIDGWAYPPAATQNQQHEVQQRLQAVLGKPESWLQALHIRCRSAEVALAPTTTFFQPQTSSQVQQFINEVTEAKVQA